MQTFESDSSLVFLASDSETALDAIKLGDFGIGVVVKDEPPDSYVGTTVYRPPVTPQCSEPRLVLINSAGDNEQAQHPGQMD